MSQLQHVPIAFGIGSGRFRAATIALVMLASACDTAVEHAGPPASGETQPVLSARARCYVSALAAADDPGTTCMADCIRSRSAVGISGGCWHACYAYRFPHPPDSLFSDCPRDPGLEPGPPLDMACEARPGSPALHGRVVDDSSGAPLHYAYVGLWPPGTYPRPGSGIPFEPSRFAAAIDTLTDAAGAFAFDRLPEGELDIVVAAGARYLRPPIETLALRQGEECRIVARLQSYDYEGF